MNDQTIHRIFKLSYLYFSMVCVSYGYTKTHKTITKLKRHNATTKMIKNNKILRQAYLTRWVCFFTCFFFLDMEVSPQQLFNLSRTLVFVYLMK